MTFDEAKYRLGELVENDDDPIEGWRVLLDLDNDDRVRFLSLLRSSANFEDISEWLLSIEKPASPEIEALFDELQDRHIAGGEIQARVISGDRLMPMLSEVMLADTGGGSLAAEFGGLSWEVRVRRGDWLHRRYETQGGAAKWDELGFLGRRTDRVRIAYDVTPYELPFTVFVIDVVSTSLQALRAIEATARGRLDETLWQLDSPEWEAEWRSDGSLFSGGAFSNI
jgi:hypothetical protein